MLIDTERGTLMVHLGMSGSLRIMPADTPPLFHDHIDIVLDDHLCLRYHDPRDVLAACIGLQSLSASPSWTAWVPSRCQTVFLVRLSCIERSRGGAFP